MSTSELKGKGDRPEEHGQDGDGDQYLLPPEIAALAKRRASARMPPDTVKAKNGTLIRAIKAQASSMNIENRQLAKILEIDYNQLNACFTGHRDFAYLSSSQRMNVARFLRVSGLQVARWCNLITLEELVVPQDADAHINDLYYNSVLKTPEIEQLAPSEEVWAEMSREAKLAYAMLYQAYERRWVMQRTLVSRQEAEQVGMLAGRVSQVAMHRPATVDAAAKPAGAKPYVVRTAAEATAADAVAKASGESRKKSGKPFTVKSSEAVLAAEAASANKPSTAMQQRMEQLAAKRESLRRRQTTTL